MVRKGAHIVASVLAAGVLISLSFARGQGQEPAAGKRAGEAPERKAQEGSAKPEADKGTRGPSFQFRGKPGDPVTLVREAAVQKELKLSKKQIEHLREALDELDARRRELMQNAMPGLPGGNADQPAAGKRQIVASGPDPVAAEGEQALAEVLEPKQITRLRQIALQQEGLVAVAREEIANKINLSIPQREAIAAIMDDMRQAQQELMRAATGGTGAMMVQAKERNKDGTPKLDSQTRGRLQKLQDGREQIRKSGLQQIDKLLTKKQGANFTRLLGEPFDFSTLSPLGQGKPLFLSNSSASAAKKKEAEGDSAEKPEPSTLKPRKQGRSLRAPTNSDR